MTKARILAQVVSAGNVLADGQVNADDIVGLDISAAEILTKLKTVDGSGSGLDADLLDGQSSAYYLDWTNTTNKPDPIITLAGDLSGSVTLTDLVSGTLTSTLTNTSVVAGIYGSSTNIPQVTVDAKGRVTTVTNVAVSIPSGSLAFTGDVTGTGSTGSSTTLTLSNVGTSGTYTKVTTDAKGRITSGTTLSAGDIPTLNQNTTGSAATLTTGRTIAMTGDITYTSSSFDGSANVTGTATLANSGVTAGTYTKVTVDAKGRTTGGTTLSASDIPSLDASKITSGVLDAARLPSYVDDVLEYTNLAGFPATGETGKIYVALDTNKTYRWSGSAYVYITSGAVDSVAGKTGVVTLVKGDVGLGNVENTALSTWVGSTNITTVGTISSGTWSGTAIALNKLAASTISGVTLGNNLNTLTLNVSGTGLSGSTTYNGSAAATFTVTSNATSNNTASTIVARDASGNFSAGTITATGIQHSGLTMTAGTNVDQIYSVTDTLTLTTNWQDTSVNAAELATGSYIVQVYASDNAVGGGHYDEYYTGIMSWFSTNTNDANSDEIILHRAGHAPNSGTIFLRTIRTATADVADLKLQIAGTTTNTGTSTYTFKFRRLI